MIAVSQEFTEQVTAETRIPRVKIDVLWTDPFINSGMVVTSNDYNRMGDLGQDYYVPGSWHDPHLVDTKRSTPHKYLSTDGTCSSDGTFFTVPSSVAGQQNNQVGWYTASVGDSDGDFSEPYPEATVSFAEARAIRRIVVCGEPTREEYPEVFEVTIYDGDDIEIFNHQYSGSSVETIIDLTSENINAAGSMKLTIIKWSSGGTMAKIVEFYGTISDVFYTDDIVSLNILEEREVENGTVPTGNVSCNECDVELQNISIIRENGESFIDPFFPNNSGSYVANSLTPNVRITPYIGFQLPNSDQEIEYVKMGVFWTNDWTTEEKNFSVQVSCRDRLELLREVEFRADEVLLNVTLYTYAEFILNHAKQNIPMNDLVWSIDTSLLDFIIPYAWLGKTTYMDALAKISAACMGYIYMDRNDVLIIKSYTANEAKIPDYAITRDNYFNRSQKSKSEGLKNRVIVPVAETIPEIEASEISTTEVSMAEGIDDTTVTIEWGDEVVLDGVAAIQNQADITVYKTYEIFYPWGCTISFHKATGTSGTFEVLVTGKKLQTESISEVTESDQDSIALYGLREYKYNINPLLQNAALSLVVALVLLDTYKNLRRDVEVEWRGNPAAEIGDCVTVPVYTPSSTGISVTDSFLSYRQQFSFEDGLRCRLTARKAVDIQS